MTKPKRSRLPFGKLGEITKETIDAAGLTKEEKKRAYQMMEAQKAYLEILDHLSYPIDPDGHTHDLNHMHMTKVAIAWTLALSGFRKSGPARIKKRAHPGPGMYTDAHTWVDIRKPDHAQDELEPWMNSLDGTIAPDTRKLAAIRDGETHLPRTDEWHTKPRVNRVFEPRPEDY